MVGVPPNLIDILAHDIRLFWSGGRLQVKASILRTSDWIQTLSGVLLSLLVDPEFLRESLAIHWEELQSNADMFTHCCTVKVHIKAVKVGTTPRAFLTQHSSTWPLVLPALQVHELVNLEESSAWSSAKTALYSVVGSGELGRRLFGEFIMDLVADDVHQIVRKASDSVFSAAKLTMHPLAS
eukprot:1269755-Amphidinium_carterae.1